MAKGILERLAEGPVLGDGGYLLELEKRGYVQAGPFTPEVVIEHPDALAQLHREFLRAGADIVGVNCLNGPVQQLPIAVEMVEAVGRAVPIAAQPVAYATTDDRPDFTGSPDFPYGLSSMTLARGDLAAFAADARDMGVRYIGSCCGSVAEHVRAMAKVLEKRPAQEREWRSQTGKAMSAYEYYDHVETEV